MRRLTITFDVAFGKDEPEEEGEEAGGDVYSSTERRPSEDHSTPTIGFGRGTQWEDA